MTDVTQPVENGWPPRVLLVGPVSVEDGGTTMGGVAVHVSELARRLSELGHEVAIYADNIPTAAPLETEWGTLYAQPMRNRLWIAAGALEGGLSIVHRTFGARAVAKACGWKPMRVFAHALGLRLAVLEHEPDLVHYHHAEMRPFYGRLAGTDLPTIITAHSLSAFRDPDKLALQNLAAENLRAADLVLAVSPDAAEALADLVPGISPRFVPNGIDVDAFAEDPGAMPSDLPDGAPLVLYLGWLATHKGVADLVEAASQLSERIPDLALALVGPEIDLTVDQVREGWRGAADHLTVATSVGRDEVVRWLHAADVFVLPSRVREGQSRVIIEAFAAGTPVVATEVGAVGDLLDHGTLGILSPAEDPRALAAAIEQSLDDPRAANARAALARDKARTFDSLGVSKIVAASYLDALQLQNHQHEEDAP